MGINPNENVINSENLKMMHEFRQGPADLFGIGWFNDVKEQTLYSNGNVGGGNAAIFIDKKNNLGIITLLNRTSWDGVADQINGKIKDVLAPNPHVHNYESWQRIYGTPYTKKLDLLGLWKGIIKEPVTEKEVPISLHFNDLGEIIMTLGGEKITLENSIYNLKGNFVSEFNGVLPSIYDKETKCVLNLNRDGNSFEGYIQYDNDSDERFYTLPLYVQLKKVK